MLRYYLFFGLIVLTAGQTAQAAPVSFPDQVLVDSGNDPVIVYSNIQGAWPGLGNIDADPLFFKPGYWIEPDILWVDGDYHLKSTGGRYWPAFDIWAIDEVHSPCIDGGDPASSVGNESEPNGGRVNQGACGGTNQASKSPTTAL